MVAAIAQQAPAMRPTGWRYIIDILCAGDAALLSRAQRLDGWPSLVLARLGGSLTYSAYKCKSRMRVPMTEKAVG